MIPLKTGLRPRSAPWVTWLLLIVNFGVFFYQIRLGDQVENFFLEFALIPQRLLLWENPEKFAYAYPLRTLLTSTLLHGGWLHLLGNMLTLWVFGGNVEDRLGHRRFFFFYALCGIASGLGHAFWHADSVMPCVGASGAIAGILGAALVLFPRAPVLVLVPIFVIVRIVRVPAFFFLILWFIAQLFLAQASKTGEIQIAVMAHIVGFVFGLVLTPLIKRPPARKRRGRKPAA